MKNSSDSFFLSLLEFNTVEPDSSVPEYTLKKHNFPTNGSVAILNANAANGSESEVLASVSSPSNVSPLICAISNGDGIYEIIASNNS